MKLPALPPRGRPCGSPTSLPGTANRVACALHALGLPRSSLSRYVLLGGGHNRGRPARDDRSMDRSWAVRRGPLWWGGDLWRPHRRGRGRSGWSSGGRNVYRTPPPAAAWPPRQGGVVWRTCGCDMGIRTLRALLRRRVRPESCSVRYFDRCGRGARWISRGSLRRQAHAGRIE